MSGFKGKGKKGGRGNSNNWHRKSRRGKGQSERSHDEKLSRKLSNLLRHRAHANGLTDCLRTDGYVPLSRVLALPGFVGRTEEEIRSVVKTNDKQRFAILEEDDTHTVFIRANQGHTISGINADELLTPILFPSPNDRLIAIHGTYHKAWPAILQSGGLSRMSRNHVHLAADLPGESGVISGMRASSELVVHVDVRAAVDAGINFYTSSNNVILTPGDANGFLSLDYVTQVVDKRMNAIVYPQPT